MFLGWLVSYVFLQIAGKINKIIRESGLKEVGQLEQDLVFGDAGTKDIINFLRTKEASCAFTLSCEEAYLLLMDVIYNGQLMAGCIAWK